MLIATSSLPKPTTGQAVLSVRDRHPTFIEFNGLLGSFVLPSQGRAQPTNCSLLGSTSLVMLSALALTLPLIVGSIPCALSPCSFGSLTAVQPFKGRRHTILSRVLFV